MGQIHTVNTGCFCINYKLGWLNDLWKFDGTRWTWISGSKEINQPGVYGIKGIADPNNVPGSRFSATSWIDSMNNLYIFGGVGYDEASSVGNLLSPFLILVRTFK